MIRINNFVRVLQLIHVVFCLALLMFVSVALILNYEQFNFEHESPEFQRRIIKISIGFIVGVIGAHVIPYLFFWRRLKGGYGAKKIKLFFTGSIWQWSLLAFLGLCLTVIFFIYPNFFVMGFFLTLFIILLAKRPTHYRLLEKTQLSQQDVGQSK